MAAFSRYLLLFVFFFLCFSCATRQRMINYDVSYAYHPEKTMVKKKILFHHDSLEIYLSYHHPVEYEGLSKEAFIDKHKFIYKITYDHYSSEVLMSDSIKLLPSDVFKDEKSFSFSFKIPKLTAYPALAIIYKKDIHRNRVEVMDIPLDFSSRSIATNYLLLHHRTRAPILNNYFTKNDTIIITSPTDPEHSLFVYYYKHPFLPASPPMESQSLPASKNLNIDTTFQVRTNEPLFFKNPGLYFIQKDTLSDAGFSFIVKDYKYPLVTRTDEMIEPLVYLTSQAEIEKIKAEGNYKTSLDSFWLQIGGSKDYSKEMIKAYYHKVEYANKAFTSYKEGWKTDRGIIYIIFGKPDQVYIWGEKEEWVYENILTHVVSFTFIKKPNLFSESHYELIRNPTYSTNWYLTIEKWKSGIITK